MDLFEEQYYHLYNRSNNNELVFKDAENYSYFLQKYRHYFENDFDTLAYCLMPTHFHFLIYVKPSAHAELRGLHLGDGVHLGDASKRLQNTFGTFLSSYTKAINKRYHRHGSLFQHHTKSRTVDRESYLLTLIAYIHRNPVRAGIVKTLEAWEHSSYREYVGIREGKFVRQDLVWNHFSSKAEFKHYSEDMLQSMDAQTDSTFKVESI